MVKIRGICKGIKCISHVFVYKERREMEIGNPTNVKHVAHIGWDNASSNAPIWMDEFKTTGSLNKSKKNNLEQQRRSQTSHDVTKQPPAVQNVPKKAKRRRKNSASSVESSISVDSYVTALEGQESFEASLP